MSNVLVACEESQAVTVALRSMGINAFSCDILPCSGGHPEWHIQGDVRIPLELHTWDMVLAFPPCTHLCSSGAKWFAEKRSDGRQQEGIHHMRTNKWWVRLICKDFCAPGSLMESRCSPGCLRPKGCDGKWHWVQHDRRDGVKLFCNLYTYPSSTLLEAKRLCPMDRDDVCNDCYNLYLIL